MTKRSVLLYARQSKILKNRSTRHSAGRLLQPFQILNEQYVTKAPKTCSVVSHNSNAIIRFKYTLVACRQTLRIIGTLGLVLRFYYNEILKIEKKICR